MWMILGVAADQVADVDRAVERHAIQRRGRDAAARALMRDDAGGEVHLRQHPAAEDVARRIGVRRHRQRAHRRLAALLAPLFAQLLVPRRCT